MTSIRSNTSDPLGLISQAAATAHKDGYQVAVLAVKQEDQGNQFTFKYEGVEGKPCKLLEHLFKEIVSGFEGACSGGVCVSSRDKCSDITRSDNDDRDKLQFLLDIASLIDSTRSKISHSKLDLISDGLTESLNCNDDESNESNETIAKSLLNSDHSMSIVPGDQSVISDQSGLIGVDYNEPGYHLGFCDFSNVENNTQDPSQKDVIQEETTQPKSSSQSNFSAIIDQIGGVTAVVMTQPPNVKIEPVDMELSVTHPVSGVSGFSDVTSRSELSEDQRGSGDVVGLNSSSSTPKAAIGGTSSSRLAKRKANRSQSERVKHHPLFSTARTTRLAQKSQYGVRKYKISKCPHCSFSNRHDRVRYHIILAHYPLELEKVTRNIKGRDSNGMFNCPQCSYSSGQLSHIQGHIISRHIPKQFQVLATDSQISTNLLSDHQDIVVGVNNSTPGSSISHAELAAACSPQLAQHKMKCDKGEQSTLPSTALTSELDQPSAPQYGVSKYKISKCPRCSFSNRQDRVRLHIIIAHYPQKLEKITRYIKEQDNDGKFHCPCCQYRSNQLRHLHSHIINQHIPKDNLPSSINQETTT